MSNTFEDLEARKQGKLLVLKVYKIMKDQRDFSYKDQIQRASMSIMNNIAEGYERSSEADKRRFIVIAKGSCAEVRSMLHVGVELGYFQQNEYNELLEINKSIGRMLYGLIKKLSN